VKHAMFAYLKHAQICSWNQSVLSNDGKVSCTRKYGSLNWWGSFSRLTHYKSDPATYLAMPPFKTDVDRQANRLMGGQTSKWTNDAWISSIHKLHELLICNLPKHIVMPVCLLSNRYM